MQYGTVRRGTFISRPNRFIAKVDIDGRTETVHVKNTGRCKEILIPGAEVILEESDDPSRKTRYDLIAAYKGDLLINIDSQAPNKVFREYLEDSDWLEDGARITPEHTHGDSRFDFLLESDGHATFVEVKGVTLESDGICRFPDAPTERGLKHIRGLERCVSEGYGAFIVFVVQMSGQRVFTPNYDTHEEFGTELERAHSEGVGIRVLVCDVEEDSLRISGEIPFAFRDHS